MQRNVSVLSVVVSLWFVAACCSAPATPAEAVVSPTEASPIAPRDTPPSDTPPGDTLQAALPEIDCSVPFDAPMCCMAETPECIACRDGALKKQARWEAQCKQTTLAPIDCSKPFEGTPCCRALLPKCTDCVDANKRNRAAYDALCGAP